MSPPPSEIYTIIPSIKTIIALRVELTTLAPGPLSVMLTREFLISDL